MFVIYVQETYTPFVLFLFCCRQIRLDLPISFRIRISPLEREQPYDWPATSYVSMPKWLHKLHQSVYKLIAMTKTTWIFLWAILTVLHIPHTRIHYHLWKWLDMTRLYTLSLLCQFTDIIFPWTPRIYLFLRSVHVAWHVGNDIVHLRSGWHILFHWIKWSSRLNYAPLHGRCGLSMKHVGLLSLKTFNQC